MGWTFPYGATRSDIISQLTPKERLYESGHIFRTLRHCCKGNVLYALHESGQGGETRKWIGVYLMQKHDGRWGYKDMEESMHPYYYNCPVSYLDDADEPVNDSASKWREEVRRQAAERKRKKPKVGERWSLKSKSVPEVRITYVRGQSVRGVYQDLTYRVPRKILGEKIEEKMKDECEGDDDMVYSISGYRKMLMGITEPTVVVITPDGEAPKVSKVDKKPDLDELQELTGGYIQIVPNKWFDEVYCDEEGKLKGYAPNWAATKLLEIDTSFDVLVGTIVILLNLPDEE